MRVSRLISGFVKWFRCRFLRDHVWMVNALPGDRVMYDIGCSSAASWRGCVNCDCKQVHCWDRNKACFEYVDLVQSNDSLYPGFVANSRKYILMSYKDYQQILHPVVGVSYPVAVVDMKIPERVEPVVLPNVHGYRSIDDVV